MEFISFQRSAELHGLSEANDTSRIMAPVEVG